MTKGPIITNYPIVRFVEPIEGYSEIPDKIPMGIRKTVEDFENRFGSITELLAAQKSRTDQWSQKEILGHLIDSAVNNHQRFVRAQYMKEVIVPAYEQQDMVRVQQYNNRPWKELLALWKLFNFHIAFIISHMTEEQLTIKCTIGSSAPIAAGFIVVDYLGHMQHHITQIEQR